MTEKIAAKSKPIGTREWYDFVAQLADLLPEMHPGGQEATRALLEMCDLKSTSQVLDVGCGPGSTACLIAEMYGSQVWGIDVSEVMIGKAKERAQRHGLTDKLEFRIANVCDLPFEDGRFDVVIFESVLTPLPGDERQAMREIVRVVRPGGRVGANEGIVDPEISQEGLALLAEHPAFHSAFTVETLCDLFKASGLEMVEAREMQSADLPRPRINLRDLLSFLFQVYPKLLLRLVRDPQIREAQKIDSQLMKGNKEYLGYALLVGRKPG